MRNRPRHPCVFATTIGVIAALLSASTPIAASAQASVSAACQTNEYVVLWNRAGVYSGMSQDSYRILTKEFGNHVTGPAGWAHVSANGYSWTKVWVNSKPGWREGWMRDGAAKWIGCA